MQQRCHYSATCGPRTCTHEILLRVSLSSRSEFLRLRCTDLFSFSSDRCAVTHRELDARERGAIAGASTLQHLETNEAHIILLRATLLGNVPAGLRCLVGRRIREHHGFQSDGEFSSHTLLPSINLRSAVVM